MAFLAAWIGLIAMLVLFVRMVVEALGSLRRRSCRDSCSSRKGSRSHALCSELVEIEGNMVKWRRREVSSSEVLQVFDMLLSWSREYRKTSFE